MYVDKHYLCVCACMCAVEHCETYKVLSKYLLSLICSPTPSTLTIHHVQEYNKTVCRRRLFFSEERQAHAHFCGMFFYRASFYKKRHKFRDEHHDDPCFLRSPSPESDISEQPRDRRNFTGEIRVLRQHIDIMEKEANAYQLHFKGYRDCI
jgi:hypothetical protein